jgi:hypothetical protein
MNTMDFRTKAAAIIFGIAVILVLLQMTPLAPLSAESNGFLRGFAVGSGIVIVVAWLAGKAGNSGS